MKKTIMTLVLMLGNILTGWCDNHLNILPAPQKIVMGEGNFVVKKGLVVVSSEANDFSANFLLDKLARRPRLMLIETLPMTRTIGRKWQTC